MLAGRGRLAQWSVWWFDVCVQVGGGGTQRVPACPSCPPLASPAGGASLGGFGAAAQALYPLQAAASKAPFPQPQRSLTHRLPCAPVVGERGSRQRRRRRRRQLSQRRCYCRHCRGDCGGRRPPGRRRSLPLQAEAGSPAGRGDRQQRSRRVRACRWPPLTCFVFVLAVGAGARLAQQQQSSITQKPAWELVER